MNSRRLLTPEPQKRLFQRQLGNRAGDGLAAVAPINKDIGKLKPGDQPPTCSHCVDTSGQYGTVEGSSLKVLEFRGSSSGQHPRKHAMLVVHCKNLVWHGANFEIVRQNAI